MLGVDLTSNVTGQHQLLMLGVDLTSNVTLQCQPVILKGKRQPLMLNSNAKL